MSGNIDSKTLELLFHQQKEHFDSSLKGLSDNIDLKFKGVYEHIEAGIEVQNGTIEFLRKEADDAKKTAESAVGEISNIKVNCARNSKLHEIFDGPKKYGYFLLTIIAAAVLAVVLQETGISKLLILLR